MSGAGGLGDACAREVQNAFMMYPVLLGDCSPFDLECLCADGGEASFANFYLYGICETCNTQPGIQIDPISALKDMCPVQAGLREEAGYSCTNYTRTNVVPSLTRSSTSQFSQSTSVSAATTRSGLSSAPSLFHPVSNSYGESSTTSEASSVGITGLSTPTAPLELSLSKTSKQGLSAGTIAGIAVGTVLVVIIALALGWFFIYRKRKYLKWPLGRSELDGNPQPHLDSRGKPRELETKEAPQELEGNEIKWVNVPPT